MLASKRGTCPLCESPLDASPGDAKAIVALREIDTRLIALQRDLSSILINSTETDTEMDTAEADEVSAQEELTKFESQEAVRLAAVQRGGFSAIRREIERLEGERKEFRAQSEARIIRKRDALREKLRAYERNFI